MVTALVLQLIQCIIKLPVKRDEFDTYEDGEAADDLILAVSYEQAMKTAHHFLSVFLKKLVFSFVTVSLVEFGFHCPSHSQSTLNQGL